MVDATVDKKYTVNIVYCGSYDSKSISEIRKDELARRDFDFAKLLNDGLSDEFGRENVYFPATDMLGGANLYTEFHRVTTSSHVTLIVISPLIKENTWYNWLNQLVIKREVNHFCCKTLCVTSPGCSAFDLSKTKCDFLTVNNIINVDSLPENVEEMYRRDWYRNIRNSIRHYAGLNRQSSTADLNACGHDGLSPPPTGARMSMEESQPVTYVTDDNSDEYVSLPSSNLGQISEAEDQRTNVSTSEVAVKPQAVPDSRDQQVANVIELSSETKQVRDTSESEDSNSMINVSNVEDAMSVQHEDQDVTPPLSHGGDDSRPVATSSLQATNEKIWIGLLGVAVIAAIIVFKYRSTMN